MRGFLTIACLVSVLIPAVAFAQSRANCGDGMIIKEVRTAAAGQISFVASDGNEWLVVNRTNSGVFALAWEDMGQVIFNQLVAAYLSGKRVTLYAPNAAACNNRYFNGIEVKDYQG